MPKNLFKKVNPDEEECERATVEMFRFLLINAAESDLLCREMIVAFFKAVPVNLLIVV